MYKFEVVADQYRKHPNTEIQLPKRATKNACAYDFYSPLSCWINPGEMQMIWTDIKAKITHNAALLINVRSSMGKHCIRLANTQGWVDADYYSNSSNDGNIGIMLLNDGDKPFEINQGDRIAQGMIIPYFIMDDDAATEERTGGFGSTGKA